MKRQDERIIVLKAMLLTARYVKPEYKETPGRIDRICNAAVNELKRLKK